MAKYSIQKDNEGYLRIVKNSKVSGSQASISDYRNKGYTEKDYQYMLSDRDDEIEHLRQQLREIKNAQAEEEKKQRPAEFNSGISLDLIKGKEPELHQIGEEDEEFHILPKYFRNIDGVQFKLEPGRGFAIIPHHRDD